MHLQSIGKQDIAEAYPCLNPVPGNFFSNSCKISSLSGAAPEEKRLTQLRSYWSTTGSRTRRIRMGGTSRISLIWYWTIVESMEGMEKAGCMMTSALMRMGRWRPCTRPVMWKSGRELLAYVREKKVRHKWLGEVEFVGEIPKSASGKILRRVLRDQARSGANGVVVRETRGREKANL